MFSQTGNQGPNWLTASVTIPAGVSQVAFEGVRGSDWQGDLALDDLSIARFACGGMYINGFLRNHC